MILIVFQCPIFLIIIGLVFTIIITTAVPFDLKLNFHFYIYSKSLRASPFLLLILLIPVLNLSIRLRIAQFFILLMGFRLLFIIILLLFYRVLHLRCVYIITIFIKPFYQLTKGGIPS